MNYPIKTPFGETHYTTSSKEAAEETEKILEARGKVVKKYMKKFGISEYTDLSLDQIIKIRELEEWKNPKI